MPLEHVQDYARNLAVIQRFPARVTTPPWCTGWQQRCDLSPQVAQDDPQRHERIGAGCRAGVVSVRQPAPTQIRWASGGIAPVIRPRIHTGAVETGGIESARTWLLTGQLARFVGLPESAWLDVKSGPYRLDNPGSAAELAKDVAAFANGGGGLLLVGFSTRREGAREIIDKLRPVPSGLGRVW